MRITSPARNAAFVIDHTPTWPSIVFETDATGPHVWRWTISWGHFKQSGRATTDGPSWDASEVIQDLGGTLVVKATAGAKQATASVSITAENTTEGEIETYLAGVEHGDVMFKLIGHETKYVHFTRRGVPRRSPDNGYGLCQLTAPVPSFAEVWNWQRNVDAGLRLYADKRREALGYLSKDKRSYTDDQLTRETVCRWNGGRYHRWDEKSKAWVRPDNIVCDSKTGNLGWNMDDELNTGKTEKQLRERDKGGYNHLPGKDDHWIVSGVCYADAVLG